MKHIISNPAASLPVTAAVIVSLLLSAGSTQAQTAPVNIVTTAVPFLSISPDARSGGMGAVGLAILPDAYSGSHNTAKTPFASDHSAIGITYTPWFRDIVQGMYLFSAAGYHQLDRNQSLSASLRYFNLGDVQVSDYSGNKLSTSNPREYSFDLGYSRKLSDKLGLGLTARYIRSDLGAGDAGGTPFKAASAVAADVSMYYDGRQKTGGNAYSGSGWTGGLVISNLGSKISYTNNAMEKDFLPANLGLGVGYTGVANEDNKWTLGIEANKLLVPSAPRDSAALADYHSMSLAKSWTNSFSNNAYRYSIGGEYGYKDLFFVRLGYSLQTKAAGDQRFFTAGLGVKYSTVGIDFSYLTPSGNGITRSPLSNTFRVGLSFAFPGDNKSR